MYNQPSMSEKTQNDLAKFLTSTEGDGKPDINSRVSDSRTGMALVQLRMLGSDGIKAADFAADIIEKLSWSSKGYSRDEVVDALKRTETRGRRQRELPRGEEKDLGT